MDDSKDPIAQVIGSSRLWSSSKSNVNIVRVQAPGWYILMTARSLSGSPWLAGQSPRACCRVSTSAGKP